MNLQTFLAAALWLTLLQSAMANENEYTNPTLGISVSKPAEWHFATADEVAENLKRVGWDDKRMESFAKKYSTAPLVAITKFEEPYDDLNPSLKVNVKPLRNFSADDPVEVMKAVTKGLNLAFKDIKFSQPPNETNLSGMKAAHASFDYTLHIPGGREFATTSELWIVPRGSIFFMIGVGYKQEDANTSGKELREIVDSIKIEHDADRPAELDNQ